MKSHVVVSFHEQKWNKTRKMSNKYANTERAKKKNEANREEATRGAAQGRELQRATMIDDSFDRATARINRWQQQTLAKQHRLPTRKGQTSYRKDAGLHTKGVDVFQSFPALFTTRGGCKGQREV